MLKLVALLPPLVCLFGIGSPAWGASRPFAIKDSRLLTSSVRCQTKVTITATGSKYDLGGQMEWKDGEPLIWCLGARHTWKGTSTDIQDGAILRIESDDTAPLVFEVTKQKGYVFRGGMGTVTLADGTIVVLPPQGKKEQPLATIGEGKGEEEAQGGLGGKAASTKPPKVACGASDTQNDDADHGMKASSQFPARPTFAPAAQNDTSGDVDKTGDKNNGTGAALPGEQPAVPLPASPPLSNPGNPSQAANTFDARRTLARACDSGEAPECYVLGVLEQKSGNLAEAKRLFAKACDGGDLRGCNNLGLLEKQSGNLATARRLYAKACVGNDMRACTNLGALEKQVGNLAEARRLFAQACNGGEALGCSGLNSLKGKAQAREQQLRQTENQEETEPYESVEKPFDPDAWPPEHGHLGLVLGLAEDRGDLLYGLGFRVGWRPLPSAEIGLLVGAWLHGLTAAAIPILAQFNGIVPLNPLWSFFGGGQLGLLHYRSDFGDNNGMVGLDAFAYGLQAGASVRLAANFSFRLELAWLHANEASTTLDTYVMEANNFFHANVAFCLTF